ncbi:JAB domain-containing protein [Mucilaginibacter pedocola]|nr:JAB domain-containing protein [Mucilaginibacter pedocola]
MVSISTSETAYKLLHSVWDQNRIELVEDFKVLLLNRACKVLGVFNVGSGSTTACVVDTKLIFVAALKTNAASIILAHNHPSGNLKPSRQDTHLTSKMQAAGEILDIAVSDHIIVTNDGYYSFGEGMAYEKVKYGDRIYFEAQVPF